MILRTTKYNPEFRNDQGHYLKEEWTAVSDIGKVFDGKVLTETDYIADEKRYARTAKLLLENFEIESFYIIYLKKYRHKLEVLSIDEADDTARRKRLFKSVKDGSLLPVDNIEDVVILCLRNDIYCDIICGNPRLRLSFGYDYYMELDINFYDKKLINDLRQIGLFVEMFSSGIPDDAWDDA
jgi:hypothetical protein